MTHPNRRLNSLAAIAFAFALGAPMAGCVLEEELATEGAEVIVVCEDENICGGNDPHLNEAGLGVYSFSGTRNGLGYQLLGVVDPAAPGTVYNVDVTDAGALIGVDELGNIAVSVAEMLGHAMVVDFEDETGAHSTIHIDIESMLTESNWTSDPNPVIRYMFKYGPANAPNMRIPVCIPPTGDPSNYRATIVAGEAYNPVTYEPSLNPVGGHGDWFAVACTGNALAKMKYLSHDPNLPAGHAYETTRPERTATIKMITARYCPGDWFSYTVSGQVIQWQNQDNWVTIGAPAGTSSVEAGWDENGATCLNTPRHVLRSSVSCAASLPICDVETLNSSKWVTYNP